MTDHILPEYRDAYIAQIPMGRYSQPPEIAAVVDVLVPDGASDVYCAVVDGGQLMP